MELREAAGKGAQKQGPKNGRKQAESSFSGS